MSRNVRGIQNGLDLNELTSVGAYLVVDPVNAPAPGLYQIMVQVTATYILQSATNYTTGEHLARVRIGDEWKSWCVAAAPMHADLLNGKCADEFAPAQHEHAQYALKQVLTDYIKYGDLTDDFLFAVVGKVADRLNVAKLGGYEPKDFVLRKEFTGENIAKLLVGQEIDATKLGGMEPDQYALEKHNHDAEYEPRNPYLLKANKAAVLKVGHRQETSNHGVVAKGEFLPSPDKGEYQRYINGGAHVIKAPTAPDDYEITLLIKNGAQAGRITFDDFTNHPAPLAPYPGSYFLIRILKVNEVADLELKILIGV